jgi:hypothetical protein
MIQELFGQTLSAACNRGKVDQQTFATCAYTLMLNDEMATSSIGSFARQQQIALDEQYAKRMSDTELKAEITSGLQQLTQAFDLELSIQTSTYLIEFSRRNLNDTSINKLMNSLEKDSKFGGCFVPHPRQNCEKVSSYWIRPPRLLTEGFDTLDLKGGQGVA